MGVEITKGDRIEKRGLGHRGTVEAVSVAGWLHIDWDEGFAPRIRPKMCAARELARLD